MVVFFLTSYALLVISFLLLSPCACLALCPFSLSIGLHIFSQQLVAPTLSVYLCWDSLNFGGSMGGRRTDEMQGNYLMTGKGQWIKQSTKSNQTRECRSRVKGVFLTFPFTAPHHSSYHSCIFEVLISCLILSWLLSMTECKTMFFTWSNILLFAIIYKLPLNLIMLIFRRQFSGKTV